MCLISFTVIMKTLDSLDMYNISIVNYKSFHRNVFGFKDGILSK